MTYFNEPEDEVLQSTDAPGLDTQPEESTNEAEATIAKLTDERDALQDQLLRATADFQNFRKRTQQEKDLLRQFATEHLVADLLPILDNFERTLEAVETGASLESLIEGVKLVEKQLRSTLASRKVARIESHGKSFDPEHHEAVVTEPSEEHEEGTILEELAPGYKMADKVLRPARVKVSKKA